ncbi:MAG: acyl-CoA/acyl-ACP dehydrogenase [Bdellovibrionales bacterium]|nr:acyl-CoA/acyl-ACP dehydrogenase [Bdellovibrionales bacterium]
MNFYSDVPEWKWMFKNAIDWEKVIPLYYPTFPTPDGFESKEEIIPFLEELADQTGAWAGSEQAIADARAMDEKGPGEVKDGLTIPNEYLSRIYKQATELGIFGLSMPPEYGGMGVPASLHMTVLGQGSRSSLGVSTQLAFFTSIADMINRYCDQEDRERLIPEIIAGNISGSMCLTEPGCGSDLSMIKTTAMPQDNGTYLINGTKCFISNGGGGIGLVLAKTPNAPEGLKGISMFLVEQKIPEKEGLNYYVSKNEEKMGLHASFTCEVVYENSVGKLIGEENEGFKMMLHLMNEARLAVGFQALGIIEASLAYANDYAKQRVAFGSPIAELPLMKRNLDDYETEMNAIRALLMDTTSHFDIFTKLDLKKHHTNDLTEEEQEMFEEAGKWVRKRTPLVKYYSCEKATELSQRAIQVLGGYGFMKEYPVEMFHRDSFAPLLYEGTSQIQALMALKDLVKYAMKDPKTFFTNIMDKHPSTEIGGNEWTRNYKKAHYRFKKKMMGLLVKTLKPKNGKNIFNLKAWTELESINKLMTHAETLCQALSYTETLRVLCDHANQDQQRVKLFNDYYTLVYPRLEAIYADWSIR